MRKLVFGRKKKSAYVHNHSFAVVGTFSGVGSTLFSINFACFLLEEYKANVAVVELGDEGDFFKLEQQMQDVKQYKKIEQGFGIGNISFFQGVSRQGYFNLLVKQYDFIIFDIGTNYRKCVLEVMNCNQKLVLGSHLEWRICEYDKFFEGIGHVGEMDRWECLDVSPGERDRVYFAVEEKKKLKRLPMIEDVFYVTDELKKIYRSLL